MPVLSLLPRFGPGRAPAGRRNRLPHPSRMAAWKCRNSRRRHSCRRLAGDVFLYGLSSPPSLPFTRAFPSGALLIHNEGVPARRASSITIYELKIILQEIRPPVWRRVQVPAKVRLNCLHDVFQIVMGWTDSHLHQFEKDGANYAVPYDEFEPDGLDVIDTSTVSLDTLLKIEGDSLVYLYDFGDSWGHDVVVEKIFPGDEQSVRPRCLAGERHCPPEDVGGVPGYEEFLEVIFDPTHEEHAHMVRWAGGRFQPEGFDLAAVNKRLSRMRWPVRCYR